MRRVLLLLRTSSQRPGGRNPGWKEQCADAASVQLVFVRSGTRAQTSGSPQRSRTGRPDPGSCRSATGSYAMLTLVEVAIRIDVVHGQRDAAFRALHGL